MKKEIDLKTYPKRNQYYFFKTFEDPTYGFDVDIDVTKIVSITKRRHHSFFEYFYYVILKAVDQVDEMRLREIEGKIYLFDTIHPTFTIMTDEGVYQNAGIEMDWDFPSFYKKMKNVIEEVKHLKTSDELDRFPICKIPNTLYTTCIPILSIKGMCHPTPAKNYDSLSVPRICWDKYRQEKDGSYHVTLNITVCHTLVDGFPLARTFNLIKEYCLDAENIFVSEF